MKPMYALVLVVSVIGFVAAFLSAG